MTVLFIRPASFALCAFLFTSLGMAQSANQATPPPSDTTPKTKEPFWDYPELLAVPSASTLVREYAQKEPSRSFASYIPLQIMGLGNVVLGLKAMSEDVVRRDDGTVSRNPKLAGQIALGVGLATIGGTYLLANSYTPYRDGVQVLKRRSTKTARARLAREREAEHVINNAASSAQSIRILGVLANLGVAGNVLGNTKDTNTEIGGALVILSAIGPFMFTPYQIELPGRYDGYKKRIYGPISYLAPSPAGTIAGNIGLRLRF